MALFRSGALVRALPSFLCFSNLALLIAPPSAFGQSHSVNALRPISNTQRRTPPVQPKIQNPKSKILSGSDVMATVEGKAITRRELTGFWLLMEPRLLTPLGGLVADKWKAGKGAQPTYTLTESDIYARLYGDSTLSYANLLANLVTNRLVAIEAERHSILVTPTEARTLGHTLLNDLRRQQNLTGDDAMLLKTYRIPPDVFLNEMTFRLRGERLLRADIERRNGHTMRPDDWVVVRQLFTSVASGTGNRQAMTESDYEAARTRLETSLKEVKSGSSMAEVARARNEDTSQTADGLRAPMLRGTEPVEVETVLRALKPGQLSAPIRTPSGWYAFRIERQGAAIGEAERNQAWQQIVATRLSPFLAELHHKAKITSVVPLPEAAAGQVTAQRSEEMPPAPPIHR